MTDRLAGVFDGPPARTVVELLRAWWGIECPPLATGTPHPPILHQLWQAGAHRLAWGHQHILVSPGRVRASDDGHVEFFVENQSCWSDAYLQSGGPNPPVAVWLDGGTDTLALGIDLDEFLARTLVVEAVFGAPWWTNGDLVPFLRSRNPGGVGVVGVRGQVALA